MRKRERENPCGICGHFHKYEEGEVCGVCGHRIPASFEKSGPQNSAFPTEIMPEFLYLGSYDNASRAELLKTQGISRVLNTVPACQNLYKNSFTYYCLKEEKILPFDEAIQILASSHVPDLALLRNFYLELVLVDFDIVFVCVEECEKEKARILVHCMSGKNRSPAIVIAYLMKCKGWRLAQSYQWVKDLRPSVSLSSAVYVQLEEYEQKVFGSNECSPSPIFPPADAPSFRFGFPKTNEQVLLPVFNQPYTTSIFDHPSVNNLSPHGFTFGAQNEDKIYGSPFGVVPPNVTDTPMDSS